LRRTGYWVLLELEEEVVDDVEDVVVVPEAEVVEVWVVS